MIIKLMSLLGKHHDPSSLSSQCNLQPAPILPYNMIKRDEASKCSVSEQHHLTQPIDHIHSIEPDGNLDCVTGKHNSPLSMWQLTA